MMENDIISNTLINENTAKIIKKLCRLASILIAFNIIYGILDLINWYSITSNLSETTKRGIHYVYQYKVRPIIAIMLLSVGVMTSILSYNGFGFILNGIQNQDPILLQKGFKKFYTFSLLSILSFSVSILSIIYRLYIYL